MVDTVSLNFDHVDIKDEYRSFGALKDRVKGTSLEAMYDDFATNGTQEQKDEFCVLLSMGNNIKLDDGDKIVIVQDKNTKRPVLVFSDASNGEEKYRVATVKQDRTTEQGNDENGNPITPGSYSWGVSVQISKDQADNMKSEDMKKLFAALESAGVDLKSIDEKIKNENMANLYASLMRDIEDLKNSGNYTEEQLKDLLDRGGSLSGNSKKEIVNELEKLKKNISGHGYPGGRARRGSSRRGFLVINLYAKNPDNRPADDKKNGLPVPDARIYIKESNGNNPLCLKYHMKDGAPISKQVVAILVDTYNDAGFNAIDVSGIKSDDDKSDIMVALAKKGIVPTGTNVSVEKARELIQEAEKKLGHNDKKFRSFRRRLIKHMEEYKRKNGKEIDQPFLDFKASILNEDRNYPLKEMWVDKGLKNLLYNEISNNAWKNDKTDAGAHRSMAAVASMNKILNAYRNFDSIGEIFSMGIGVQTPKTPHVEIFKSIEEKDKVMHMFAKSRGLEGKSEAEIKEALNDLSIQSLSMAEVTAWFNIAKVAELPEKRKEIEQALEMNFDGKAKKAPSIVLKDTMGPYKTQLNQTIDALKAEGCEITLPQMNDPQYYPGMERWTQTQQQNNAQTNNNGR